MVKEFLSRLLKESFVGIIEKGLSWYRDAIYGVSTSGVCRLAYAWPFFLSTAELIRVEPREYLSSLTG